MATSAVMIFVVDAIGRRMCSRFDQRTRPVLASMTIAAGALTFGPLTCGAPLAAPPATRAARPTTRSQRQGTANECSVGP